MPVFNEFIGSTIAFCHLGLWFLTAVRLVNCHAACKETKNKVGCFTL